MKPVIFSILLAISLPVWSQQDRIDSLLNELLYDEIVPKPKPEKPTRMNFIYAGSNFNSNTYYAGREIGADQYNLNGYVYFYSSKGFFLGVSGNYYDEITPGYTTTVLSAGYYKTFNKAKTLTFRTSYSRYIYNEPDTGLEYPYKNNANLGLSYRKKWFGARASSNFLFGEDFGMNFSIGSNARLTLLKFGKHNKIRLSPDVSVFIGSETVEVTNSASQGGSSSQNTDLKDVYGLLNTQVYVPLSISLGDFDLEMGYTVNFPTSQDEKTNYPVTSYYSVSIGYFFTLF